MDHAHESPQVMLVPLYILAAGALFAGLIFAGPFIGEAAGGVLEGLARASTTHLLEEMHHTPFWIASLPTIAMLLGFAVAWRFYIRAPETPVRLAEEHQVLYRFLLNKWYFDEIYDALLVRPAMALGRFLWKKGDGWLIDGFGPDGVSARVIDVTRERGAAADRLPLPLRLRDAARRRAARHLDDVRGMRRAMRLADPLRPSPILPLVGAAIIFLVHPRRRATAAPAQHPATSRSA